MSALAAGSARCPLDTDHSRPVSIARIRDKSNTSAKCAAHWTTMMQCRPVGQHRGEFLSASRGLKLRRPHDPLTADTHSSDAYPCLNVYYPGGVRCAPPNSHGWIRSMTPLLPRCPTPRACTALYSHSPPLPSLQTAASASEAQTPATQRRAQGGPRRLQLARSEPDLLVLFPRSLHACRRP